MQQTPNTLRVNQLKKDLNACIKKNNYDLLSPEVISLSMEIDKLITPVFKAQLDLYYFYKQYKC